MTLNIPKGSFTSLLGPSGCGKTTTLRMIAGFEQPTEGEILLAGRPIAGVPPYHRNVNTVFQHYALFPHMDVAQNVGYGLRQKKIGRRGGARRVDGGARARPPRRLRATPDLGAVRRPAAARRARPSPREPPDGAAPRRAARRARPEAPQGDAARAQGPPAGGRDHVRLRDPRPGGGADDVATSSSSCATAGSSRWAARRDLYERPVNRFVADFIGSSNFLAGHGRVVDAGDRGDGRRADARPDPRRRASPTRRRRPAAGDAVTVAIRPERLEVAPARRTAPADRAGPHVAGRIHQGTYLGDQTEYRVHTDQAGELDRPPPERHGGESGHGPRTGRSGHRPLAGGGEPGPRGLGSSAWPAAASSEEETTWHERHDLDAIVQRMARDEDQPARSSWRPRALTSIAAFLAACTGGGGSVGGAVRSPVGRRHRAAPSSGRIRRTPSRRRPRTRPRASCSCTTGATTSSPTTSTTFKAEYGVTKFTYDIFATTTS